MRKLLLSSTAILTLALSGCGSVSNTVYTGERVVKTGVVTGTAVVNTAGTAVVTTVGTGVDIIVGRPATYTDVQIYNRDGVVYRNGRAYHIQSGRYILVP